MEQIRELPSGKCFRKYSPEHPLFAAGTLQWAAKYYQQPESMVQPEEVIDKAEDASTITCRLATCNVTFQSVVGYEEHYDMVHRNICRDCSQSFLSLRLLDIHISETHDAFFKLLSKKKPMYVCLVDGCPDTFQSDDKRTRHLIQVHQYPESFSFHHRRKHRKNKTNIATAGSNSDEGRADVEVDPETIRKREARKRRRQQKKKKLHAQFQSSDMIVDAEGKGNGHASGDTRNSPMNTGDIDMMDLETSMSKLRIPKSIQFGRKRRV
ncbi:hypothetical protein PHYBOEH_010506 [Phytophthora boehmeriae]|uniref:C2H2-type domain-containing protein n=1 Tax=Phytophthora boehmeriae TaxID=109152 RepID=A0A8T1X3Y3_9STRA|nr:hypothetical protein PHYBOEH_010506 [Phytophthora boehmeriae]